MSFDYLNNLHPNMRFTMEIEGPQGLPVLDIFLYRRCDGSLGHHVYRKPTRTNVYMNTVSHHLIPRWILGGIGYRPRIKMLR